MKIGRRIVVAVIMMVMIVTGSSMTAEAAKFNPAFYAEKYADVKAAVGMDANALYNHYITCGQKEGRMPDSNLEGGAAVTGIVGLAAKFNPEFYAAEYADLRTAFGTNANALYNHYITLGQKEGRIPYAGATGGEAVSGIATAQEIQAAQVHTTYVINYVNDVSTNDWRYQTGNTWQDGKPHKSLYYLQQSIKDGDLVVVSDSPAPQQLNLKLPVTLNNVTFAGSRNTIITATGVENVYVLKNSIGVVNGNVTNAYVYDNAIANFNDNVEKLYVMEASSFDQSIGVGGTVAYAEENRGARIKRFYSFKKDKFSMESGVLKTPSDYYSLTP